MSLTMRNRTRRTGLLTALAALLAILLFTACGDDEPDDTASPAATSESTAEAADASSASSSSPTVEIAGEGDARYLVGPTGHTLYLFANDGPSVSNCSDGCAGTWPPLLVTAGAEPSAADGIQGALAVIDRADGDRQITLGGAPLYYYAADTAPGDRNGDGVGGVWSIARPTGTTPTSSGVDEIPGY
jgi:predicted lipoprotein with Yx(FWY)xxD motif